MSDKKAQAQKIIRNLKWRDTNHVVGIFLGSRKITGADDREKTQILIETEDCLYLAIAPTVLLSELQKFGVKKGDEITITYDGYNEEKDYAMFTVSGNLNEFVSDFN